MSSNYAPLNSASVEEIHESENGMLEEDSSSNSNRRDSNDSNHGVFSAAPNPLVYNESLDYLPATGTIFSSYINITNTILGTGMLAMPLAIANVGLLFGIVMISGAAFASALGLYLLSKCAHILGTRTSSFFACTNYTIPQVSIAFDSAIAIKCFGVSISYLVVVGDLMPKVMRGVLSLALMNGVVNESGNQQSRSASYPMENGTGADNVTGESLWTSKLFWITLGILAIAPISFYKQLNSLKYTSMLALVAVVYLLFVVISFFLFPIQGMPPKLEWKDVRLMKLDASFFTTLPIFVFAFTCHQNIFAVYNELADNSMPQLSKVIKRSILTSYAVYVTIGLVGFFTFGYALSSNLIAMYPASPIITGGQFAIALLVLLSYPLQCHPCRLSLDKILNRNRNIPMTSQQFNIVTTAILLGSYLIAITVKDLSTVLSLVGATGSTTICYILPGLLYYKMVDKEESVLQMPQKDLKLKTWAFWLACFGIAVMTLSVTMQIYNLVNSEKSLH